MKFKIRFADQIVGIFSIAAILGLIVLVFAIGANQNWFAKKYNYFTIFEQGNGLSTGQTISYKGFAIGKVKTIALQGSTVRADYYILGEYADYVREYSLVELNVSPIGLGSSFVLHPGSGSQIMPNDSEIFRIDSLEGERLIKEKRNLVEKKSDSMTNILNKIPALVDNINSILEQVNSALDGNSEANTEIARAIKRINGILESVNDGLAGVGDSNVASILGNINALTGELSLLLSDEKGILPSLLGPELTSQLGETLKNVAAITKDVNGILDEASPHLDEILLQVNGLLVQARDVVNGVKNIGIIRRNIEDYSAADSATVQMRSDEF